MSVHPNSAKAHNESLDQMAHSRRRCYDMLLALGRATDRGVLEAIYGPQERDMNKVRPRISELLLDCWVKEVTSACDHRTGARVRVCRALTAAERLAAKAAEERRRHLITTAVSGNDPQPVRPTAAAFRDAYYTRDEEAFTRLTTALELLETR